MLTNLIKTALASALALTLFSIPANAQQRDNLTYEEIEMIRDEQALDGTIWKFTSKRLTGV